MIEVAPEWKEGHVESNVTHSWIGFEDGNDGKLNKHEKDGVFPRIEGNKMLNYFIGWLTD